MAYKISQKSWHYKLYDMFDAYKPDTFCQYWRRILLNIVVAGMIATIIGVVLWAMVAPFLVWFFPWVILEIDIYLISGILWLLIGVATLSIVRHEVYYNRIKNPLLVREVLSLKKIETAHFPSFLTIWWDAFHNKICPTIEIVRD